MNVSEGLHDLLSDEPPFVLRPDEVVASGRRRHRRHVAGTALTAGAAAVVTVGAFVVLAPSGRAPTATVGFGAPSAAATTAADTGDLDNPYYRIARAHTPSGWVISKASVDGEGMWADVTDDRGDGPGRLGLSISRGGLQQHPCSDAEFVAKAASCVETQLDPDTRLVVRTASKTNVVEDVQVGIIHANGDGAYASDDNAVWPDPPQGRITPEQKRALTHGTVGSADPVYDLADLEAMARDLDALRAATPAPVTSR